MKTSLKDIVMSLVKTDDKGCWIWHGKKYPGGKRVIKSGRYKGRVKIKLEYGVYKHWPAHRFSWMAFNGAIPSGRLVCHHCDNPLCVNPSHLFLGSSEDNNKDAKQKNRHSFGERHPNHKLTDQIVKEMRLLYKPWDKDCSYLGLAKRFNCAEGLVCDVVNGKRWQHVKPMVAPALKRRPSRSQHMIQAHRDGTRKWAHGEKASKSKLTASEVKVIRERNQTRTSLAKEFGVSAPAISAIILGKTWKHLL